MAKISAWGDAPATRWTREPGEHLVLTTKRRLLRKGKNDSTYHEIRKRIDLEEARSYAQKEGWS